MGSMQLPRPSPTDDAARYPSTKSYPGPQKSAKAPHWDRPRQAPRTSNPGAWLKTPTLPAQSHQRGPYSQGAQGTTPVGDDSSHIAAMTPNVNTVMSVPASVHAITMLRWSPKTCRCSSR